MLEWSISCILGRALWQAEQQPAVVIFVFIVIIVDSTRPYPNPGWLRGLNAGTAPLLLVRVGFVSEVLPRASRVP